jgi:hypothetical protein
VAAAARLADLAKIPGTPADDILGREGRFGNQYDAITNDEIHDPKSLFAIYGLNTLIDPATGLPHLDNLTPLPIVPEGR